MIHQSKKIQGIGVNFASRVAACAIGPEAAFAFAVQYGFRQYRPGGIARAKKEYVVGALCHYMDADDGAQQLVADAFAETADSFGPSP